MADFRRRAHAIFRAREGARQEFERYGLAEADAEHDYRKERSVAFASYRSDGCGVTEAEILAEGDVAPMRKARDRAHVLRRSAEMRAAELERNAASLRTEAAMSGKDA